MTPERFRRLKAVLERRQPDLTVVMENVHKPHNFNAIVRTCDAVGVFEAHAMVPPGRRRPRGGVTSGGSHRWVRQVLHREIETPIQTLRERGFQILAAHLSERAVDFRRADYTRPTAILLGQELDGVSPEASRLADGEIVIPMHGMVASLNVSVAAALILFEAQRQRQAAGFYAPDRPTALDPEVFHPTLFEWAHPKIAARCRELAVPYPRLNEDGEFLDPVPR
jgi:tRNA (guanosine-2'-O-)-methyltransferase